MQGYRGWSLLMVGLLSSTAIMVLAVLSGTQVEWGGLALALGAKDGCLAVGVGARGAVKYGEAAVIAARNGHGGE